ncbi:hypothetical protein BOX15_Mlig001419g4, partial [Macrostomum lignano]
QPQSQAVPLVTPQVVTGAPAAPSGPTNYASRLPPWVLRGHRIMGLLQLLTGALLLVIGIFGLADSFSIVMKGRDEYLYYHFRVSSAGLWTGPFVMAAGISGMSAARNGCGCALGCVITCLVLSIIASVAAFFAMVSSSVTSVFNQHLMDQYTATSGSRDDVDVAFRKAYAISVVCALLCAFDFVLAIVHSAFACRASCCCVPPVASSQQPQQVIYLAQPGYPGQQAGYPGQQAGYPGQQAGYPGQQAGYPGQQAGSSAYQFADCPPPYEQSAGEAEKVRPTP